MRCPKGDPCQLLAPYLRVSDVAVDVGASVGTVTEFLAERVGHVHAIEPHPEQVKTLRMLAAKLKNVTVHEVACGNVAGVRTLTLGTQATASSLTALNVPLPLKACLVNVVRLDARVDHADVLKIDAQGSDDDVLRGAMRILWTCRVVVIECWPKGLERAGSSASELVERLFDAGLTVRTKLGEIVTTAGLADWQRECTDHSFTNFVAVR